jgi:hypothetical protein
MNRANGDSESLFRFYVAAAIILDVMSQPPQPQRVIPIEQTPPHAPYASYGTPVPPRLPSRPGILTALGVVSIVLACLMVVSNCGSIISVMVLTATTRAMNLVMTSAAAAQAQAARDAQNADGAGVKPRGLSEQQQAIVVAGLSRVHPLSPSRAKILRKLLAEDGQDMFPMDASHLTPGTVAAGVSQSGQLPGVGNKLGNDYYVIGNGRMELADDHAVFAPTDGGEVVRVYDGTMTIAVDEQDIQPAGAAVTTMPTTMPAINAPTISNRAIMLSVLDAVVSCILAIFLFICGLFVLRDSMAARRMHIGWAIVKTALAALGGFSVWMMISDLASNNPGGADMLMAAMMSVLAVAVALIYPIAVLIVMNARSVRDYYSKSPKAT